MSNDDGRIVPQRDEALSRTRQVKSPEGRKAREPGAACKGEGGGAARAKNSTPAWIYLLLLVSFAASGYLFYQLQQLQQLQSGVSQRVGSLEGRLSITDESFSQSGAAMQAMLQEHAGELELHMSEIRKLWGVAYDTNRKSIDELKVSMTQSITRLDQLSASLKTLATGVARVDALGSQMLILSADVEDVLTRVRATRDELNEQSLVLSRLQASATEQSTAIDSVDSFRLQFNQRLIQLENEIRSLSAGSSP